MTPATLRFLDAASKVLFVGPLGVGKTMLSVALGRPEAGTGHRVCFTTTAKLAAKPPPVRGCSHVGVSRLPF
ncbi:ATP-binding protein [Streptomyces globisporus]|uniref:ATP-binding protein n=1 Tax=Streptomyces globisporus TaxID=1908 RepID=UPI00099DC8FB|nr:ATP-binding protein [Streptomyces globisporus]